MRDISAPKKKKAHHNFKRISKGGGTRSQFAEEDTDQLDRIVDEELDDDLGMRDFEEPAEQPEYQDEIDIVSEG